MSNLNHRMAVVMAHVTLAGAALLPLLAAVIWLFWDQLAPLASANLQHVFDLTSLGVGARFAGFGIFFIGALVHAYGLLGLRQTFQEAAQQRSLSAKSINGFRRFAWVTLAMVFFGVLQRTGLIIIFSISDPAHQGTLSFEVGTNELKALFIALLLVFVGHVFADGKRAKDENEAFL